MPENAFAIFLLIGCETIPDLKGQAANGQCHHGAIGEHQADQVNDQPGAIDNRLQVDLGGRSTARIDRREQTAYLGHVIRKEQIAGDRGPAEGWTQSSFGQQSFGNGRIELREALANVLAQGLAGAYRS
ncbi:hypothetical protein D3C81_1782740 [compost metagenome]